MVVQPNMQVHEDLAALFSRNLTLEPAPAPQEEPKITYISQHYHHSAHVARQPQDQPIPQQRPASEPPQPEHLAVETVLKNHGVDASALSASQLQLFKTADEPQQVRLIELWRICPPTNSNDNPTLAWGSTSVEQEEILARLRFDRKLQEEQQGQTIMSLDGTALTPIQAGDGRWMPAVHHYMEPYMESGYEALARREYEESARREFEAAMAPRPKDIYNHFGTAVGGPNYSRAMDPVYQTTNSGLDWRQQQAMENQYGAFEQFRNDDMEVL